MHKNHYCLHHVRQIFLCVAETHPIFLCFRCSCDVPLQITRGLMGFERKQNNGGAKALQILIFLWRSNMELSVTSSYIQKWISPGLIRKMLIKMLNFIVFLWIKPQKMRHQLKVQNIGHLYTILKRLIFKVIKISRNKITEIIRHSCKKTNTNSPRLTNSNFKLQ